MRPQSLKPGRTTAENALERFRRRWTQKEGIYVGNNESFGIRRTK